MIENKQTLELINDYNKVVDTRLVYKNQLLSYNWNLKLKNATPFTLVPPPPKKQRKKNT